MRRAAIYARISDDPEGAALGVTRQVEDCQELASRRGWSVVESLYVDNDTSASRGKPRPEYQRLLSDMESGDVQAVIVWALDRLHRRPVELEHFMDLAESRGVLLASVAGDVDLGTEDGQFHARIMGAVAAKEARAISRRVRRKQQELREQSKPFGGGIRPFGWDYDRMTPIPSEAAEIRAIAQRLVSGQSVGEIVRDLNERGVPTVSQRMAEDRTAQGRTARSGGRPWSRTSVRSMMSKPRLAGLLTYKGEVLGPGAWRPVLTAAEFQQVQIALQQRRPHKAASNSRRWLLSGIATCSQPDCGKGLQVANQGPGVKGYKCPTGRHVTRSMKHLDRHVTEAFLDHLEDLHGKAYEYAEEGHEVEDEIGRVTVRLAEAADMFADGSMTGEQFQRITATLRGRLADLERQRPSQVGPPPPVLADHQHRDEARAEWQDLTLSQQRFLLSAHLSALIVHPTKARGGNVFDPSTVEIIWKP